MPRYKITEHQTGWQTLENFIDAKDKDDAHEKHNVSEYVNKEWKIIDEEYRNVDMTLEKVGDTPTEEVKKWRESKVISGNDYEINADGTEVK